MLAINSFKEKYTLFKWLKNSSTNDDNKDLKIFKFNNTFVQDQFQSKSGHSA
jgi:hypothetical protein